MSKPRILADILKDYFQNSDEPLAVEFRKYFAGTNNPLLSEKLCQREQNSNLFEVLPNAADFGRSQQPSNDTLLEEWIDGQEVMLALHISPRTLQTLRSNGTLPFSRIGSKLYYRKQDILKILFDNYTMRKIKGYESE